MANNCWYQMKVSGKPESIREFIKVIQYEHPIRSLSRVFEAGIDDEESIDAEGYVHITGDCAWSVHTCMMEGQGSYVNDSINEHRKALLELEESKKELGNDLIKKAFFNKKKKELESFPNSSLIRESEILNLTIEVFSEECGLCFSEHLVVDNGKLLVNDCVDYREYYFEEEDENDTEEQKKEKREEIEEFLEKIKEFDPDFTEDKIVYGETMRFGGHGDWNFDEWENAEEDKDLKKEVV